MSYDEMDDMPCGETGCICYCVGAGHACGCDCPHPEDCECPECVDDEDEAYEDAEEWTEEQCDNCPGDAPADVDLAAKATVITPVCACAIGQGARSEDCLCGPEVFEGGETEHLVNALAPKAGEPR